MALKSARVTVVLDKTADIMRGIGTLAENRVMAGVPSDKAARASEDGNPINNAQLMYIHENGAPEVNIPARPVVHPAIRAARNDIVNQLRAAGIEALAGNVDGTMKRLSATGLIAQNAMQERITEGPFVPLSPRTVEQRARKRGTKRRKDEQQYLDLIAGGMDPAAAQTAANIKPLIDTGALRRALTYVIRKRAWTGKVKI